MQESLSKNPRFYYLDNIRSVIIVVVVIFHAILPYAQACPWWYVNDPPPISYSFFFLVFLEPILMPVLFFIAGLLTWPSFERKGASRFLIGKVKRLLLPFLFCTFLFSPIMPFIRQRLRGASSGGDSPGFWTSWIHDLQNGTNILSGSASTSPDIIVNQYWFLMLLFIFFAGFCLFALKWGKARGLRSSRRTKEPMTRASMLGSITIFSLVLGAIYAFICLFLEGNVWVTLGSLWQIQPAKIHIYLGFFLAGIFLGRRNLLDDIQNIAHPAVWFAAATLITAAYLTTVIRTAGIADAPVTLIIASRFLRIFFIVTVSLWLLTVFRRRIDKNPPFWRELSANSYNIYLIHMVPLVVIQLLALSWPVISLIKFIIISLLTLLLSYLVSRFLVNRSTNSTILVLILIFVSMCLAFP